MDTRKPNIYRYNLATYPINAGHEFIDINKMTLIKHITLKGTIMNFWENLRARVYAHTHKHTHFVMLFNLLLLL